jgi:hypothetical protein
MILSTSERPWVLKVVDQQTRSAYELRVILEIYEKKPRHAVELPESMYWLYGRSPSAGWFALQRFDGCLEADAFARQHWKRIAVHCLRFLQDFHHSLGLVHADIKKANILYLRNKLHFAVADYEHAEKPNLNPTRVRDPDYKWYYMSLGAEMDEPLVSWRFDLVSLGYVLASITRDTPWTFEDECWNRRKGRGDGSDVIATRAKEIAESDPVILAYLARVSEVSWSAKDPPPRSFYKELEELFTSVESKSFRPPTPNLTGLTVP